ncbi:MAG: HesB/IscA family protein [Planctomycetota bacterium]|jgi:iron-sulfur cluster assembly protein
MAVTVTEIAAREVWSICKQQNLAPETIHLRVGVKGGGCSGFSYLLDLTESKRDTDEVWEYTYTFLPAGAGAASSTGEASGGVATAGGDGEAESFTLRVICDPKSYLYLNGTVVDFKDELMGRGFVFNNPNATSTCGCGSSFGV